MMTSWDEPFETILRSQLRALPDDVPLGPDQNLAALGLDSMASVELLLALEEHYAMEIPDELLQPATFATAAALWKAISGVRAAEPHA
jgi:diaminopimelate decarboxylase